MKPRIQEDYERRVLPELVKHFGYENTMQAPRLSKIVLNMGVGEGAQNVKVIDSAMDDLSRISGQRPAARRAKKSVANFKLREGHTVGAAVTLPLGLGAGVSLGLGISVLSVWLARRAGWARRLMSEFRSLLGGLSPRDILLIAALSSVGEEMFFRGILLPGLGHVLSSPWLGLAASSLIFGLLHVPASLRMVPWTLQAVAMGFLLGFLFVSVPYDYVKNAWFLTFYTEGLSI